MKNSVACGRGFYSHLEQYKSHLGQCKSHPGLDPGYPLVAWDPRPKASASFNQVQDD